MAVAAKVLRTFPANPNRPEAILWEGVLVWEDPTKLTDDGAPTLVLKVQCGLRSWEQSGFLTMPQRMEAFVNDEGVARMRANKWEDSTGKTRYTPLVTLGRPLSALGVKAVFEYLKEQEAVPVAAPAEEGPATEPAAAAGAFDSLDF